MDILEELPEWAKWVARDENGKLWTYEYKPYKCYTYWDGRGGEMGGVSPHQFPQVKWTDDEPTLVPRLQHKNLPWDSTSFDALKAPVDKYIAELTNELYAVQERRLQLFLENHPELDVTDLYFKGGVDRVEVRGTGEGDYIVTQVLPSIHVKPRTTTVTGEMSSQAVQDVLSLYSNHKVKITIEVE